MDVAMILSGLIASFLPGPFLNCEWSTRHWALGYDRGIASGAAPGAAPSAQRGRGGAAVLDTEPTESGRTEGGRLCQRVGGTGGPNKMSEHDGGHHHQQQQRQRQRQQAD
ncbi:hypothetical protein PLESTM_000268100 [Pleodorina starrii]|nr:hypothetical protein PLESTM_000268100 [Pleodorina starrii]